MWIDTIVGVAVHFFRADFEKLIGVPISWAVQLSISLLIVIAMRLLSLSIGTWLLAYATAERQRGIAQRQWPNLVLGTLGVWSGLDWIASRLTGPDDGSPFFFMVQDTPLKLVALLLYGAVTLWSGVLLLRFSRGARRFNWVLLGFMVAIMILNLLFFHEAMVLAQVARRMSQGLSTDREAAEAVIMWTPLYGGIAFGLIAFLLYRCREEVEPAPSQGPV